MTRRIQDQDLQLWEAYASSGKFGSADRGKIIFQCLSDPNRRARVLLRHATKADAEKEVAELTEAELVGLLGSAQELA